MMKLQMRVGGMFWCAAPPPAAWIAMPVEAALTDTPVVLALSETPVALACEVATLAPAPTLSTNPNSETPPLVVAPVEKFMLWLCGGSLTPWLWLGSLTPGAWAGSLTPWPGAGISAVISVTRCAAPAGPRTARGRRRRAQRLRSEPVDVQGAGAGVARVRGERDHGAVHVRERVEHLEGGERIGARAARGRDRAGDVVAVFRRRRHHGARGIVDRRGRLALGPVDRAVDGGVVGRGARPFPEAHCRTSKASGPFRGRRFG